MMHDHCPGAAQFILEMDHPSRCIICLTDHPSYTQFLTILDELSRKTSWNSRIAVCIS